MKITGKDAQRQTAADAFFERSDALKQLACLNKKRADMQTHIKRIVDSLEANDSDRVSDLCELDIASPAYEPLCQIRNPKGAVQEKENWLKSMPHSWYVTLASPL